MYAGDEVYGDGQVTPELESDHLDDYLDEPCAECGADAGERCEPWCIATHP